jgi:predicted  nucleic acid-binding Zn-ribbon protein
MNTQPTPETDSAYIQRPNEGAWDFRVRQEKTMEKLERELGEARFDLDFRRELFKLQSNTLESVTAQRDEAREQLAAARAEIYEIHATVVCSYTELHKVTEQRDRLAVALKSIASGAVYEAKCISIARETLQSLTPKP